MACLNTGPPTACIAGLKNCGLGTPTSGPLPTNRLSISPDSHWLHVAGDCLSPWKSGTDAGASNLNRLGFVMVDLPPVCDAAVGVSRRRETVGRK
jgi:hypothetical protein